MKEMNSETHSCTHSLASFDTFALMGNEFFMILETLAICDVQCQHRVGEIYVLRNSEQKGQGAKGHEALLTGSHRSCSLNSSTWASVKGRLGAGGSTDNGKEEPEGARDGRDGPPGSDMVGWGGARGGATG